MNWEQPGAGKSYHAADFNAPRIVLVGHSWGSTIGLMAAHPRPDLYHRYVGIAQQVNSVENDTIGYRMVLERAREKGDRKVVDRLTKQGPPLYTKEESGAYETLFSNLPNCPPSTCSKISLWEALVPQEYSGRMGERKVKVLP